MSIAGENDQYIVQYLSDTGELFQIMQKAKNSTAVLNVRAPFRQNQGLPPRWRPRTITIELVKNGKLYSREIEIGDANNILYRTNGARVVTIDGEQWRVKSRRGESMRGPAHS